MPFIDDRPAAASAPRALVDGARLHPRFIALIVGCALFMQMLDSTIVAAALPSMARAFDSNPLDLGVVITSYLMALTVLIPISAWLAERFGARTVFLWSIGVFALGSLACGLAPSLDGLVAARLVQGAAGAMMVPVGRVLIVRAAAKTELLDAMAYLAIPALVAPLLGPPLGGFIVVHGSWRWIFLMNVPIAILTLLLAVLFIARDRNAQPGPLDVTGFLLTSAGLGCILMAMESVSRPASSRAEALSLWAVGMLSCAAYVLHSRKAPHALLNLALLRIPTFRVSIIGGNLCRLSLGALPVLLTLLLQVGFGLDAFRAGMITLATAIGSLVVTLIVSRLARLWGIRRMLIANSLLGGSLIMVCALLGSSMAYTAIPLLLFAIGFLRSLQLNVSGTLGYADLPEASVAAANSLASTVHYLAIAAGAGLAMLAVRVSALLSPAPQLTHQDIGAGFIAIGALFLGSSILFATLPRGAGAELIAADAPAARDTGSRLR